MIPGEASGWTEFDVLAIDAAVGAHVAMRLREALAGAFIRSEPSPGPSGDDRLPHRLRCSTQLGDRDPQETRRRLEDALGLLDVLAGPDPRARVVFPAEHGRDARPPE